jgi:segregation and condensation protein B
MFADEPLTARRIAALAGLSDAAEANRLVNRLRELYRLDDSAFQVADLAGGYQLLTRPEFHPWLARLRQAVPETQLTAAARETLAIVAYRQPVTRADVEAIRGVGSSDVLERLLERGLIRLAGRDDSLGRPTLYETTKKFLQLFGLKSLRELPPAEGLSVERDKKTKEGEE